MTTAFPMPLRHQESGTSSRPHTDVSHQPVQFLQQTDGFQLEGGAIAYVRDSSGNMAQLFSDFNPRVN